MSRFSRSDNLYIPAVDSSSFVFAGMRIVPFMMRKQSTGSRFGDNDSRIIVFYVPWSYPVAGTAPSLRTSPR